MLARGTHPRRVAPMPMRSMPGRRLATRCPDTEEMRELVEAGHYRRHCKGYVKNLIRLVRRTTDTSCHTLRHSWTSACCECNRGAIRLEVDRPTRMRPRSKCDRLISRM